MKNVIRFIREQEDEQRAKQGVKPLTDRQLAGKLLGMKCFSSADVVLAKMYAEQEAAGTELVGVMMERDVDVGPGRTRPGATSAAGSQGRRRGAGGAMTPSCTSDAFPPLVPDIICVLTYGSPIKAGAGTEHQSSAPFERAATRA